ncbi:hypothetical protein ACVWWI_006218 [Bradyrhizobium sp. USDA 3686]|uniref:hypothetical protein n=1 Tax=Bradyrhizobium canariense TaxID=255045 RepID=UPI00195D18D8|nr:hypothetical protein [Bradyrhizobium canariense]MBM7488231.1 hypothetical protein [Bradyrhizobium canariense]
MQQHRKDRRQHEERNERHFRAERRKPDRAGQQELLVRGGAGGDKKVRPKRVLIQMVETRRRVAQRLFQPFDIEAGSDLIGRHGRAVILPYIGQIANQKV